MTRLTLLITCFFIFSFIYCNSQEKLNHAGSTEPSLLPGSFGYDLEFLNQFDQVILLASKSDSALVIVSPKYQAKVFTSTSDGLAGKSFGWINYNAFRKKDDPHMNAYGGESRFWLGPEGGPFSIFFPKGKPIIFEHWKTPSPIDNEVWMVSDRDLSSVSLKKEMSIVNYKGIVLNILAQRNIRLLERDEIIRILGFEMTGESLRMVGYESQNSITNSGEREWNEREGMPCIWILDMFTPTDSTIIMLLFKEAGDL